MVLLRGSGVMGLPFYGYEANTDMEGAKSYKEIVANDASAYNKDYSNGMAYNGIPTIQKKCSYVMNNGYAGGKNNYIVYLAVESIFSFAGGQPHVRKHGKLTEMGKEQHAGCLLACFRFIRHYFFARGKRAELYRQLP